ncbi:hypothetical protein VC83_08305 [Pseudogymnoascus destructans]|uniref:Zn(2)-C6 fungal-type domain-containing protein n=2 Tax=Pseudogymnoascus destructans TaxID=655981 RepID=L8G1L1_PSED2|nr:uncharacterized protein VC83_08305 [Pseudogymnoascus destructans]ELR05856.1 hypothetical protein GMDG_07629 [Pseudogymnoascus destructans 20631-21]OAF55389.1 hypothetical protein VC83_08305 [Pseudogymnoascus destructans]
MDTGPPDAKRIRADPSPWSANAIDSHIHRHPRGHPYPQTTLPRQQRRLSGPWQHHEPDNTRRHPQAHPYDSYGTPGPRDPAIKPDPNEPPPLPNPRPHSEGHRNEGHANIPPGDLRVQPMRPYDHPPAPSQGPQHYIPQPQQSPMHTPRPGQLAYDGNGMYEQNGGDGASGVPFEYTGVASALKKRTPRTTMACDACRAAKAKCTDPKPCQGCKDKGIECKFPEPAQKPADRAQSDIMTRMTELIKEVQDSRASVVREVRQLRHEVTRLHGRQRVIERGLCPANPGLSALLVAHDERTRLIKKEDDADDLYELERPTKMHKSETNGVRFAHAEDDVLGDDAPDSDDGSENHAVANVPPGEPAIPVGHTTGAANIILWPAVWTMVGHPMKGDKNRGLNPLRREIKRGVMRLYGRGEGFERSVGHDKDSTSDYDLEPPRSSSDTYSDSAHSLTVEHNWSQGAQSPVADSYLFRAESDARAAAVNTTAPPDLDEKTVRHLAGSYMNYLNVMHPIITQKSLDGMIAKFMRNMQNAGATEKDGAGYNFASFAGTDTTGSKRKRLPTVSGTDHAFAPQLGHGWRHRTISEAIVLLILALGKVCEHRSKIPDVVLDNGSSNHVSPPIMNQSPQMSSRSSMLPSPIMQDRAHHRSSSDIAGARYPPGTRNIDVIPGLAYFAAASDILGNHQGGTGLPYVHACLLAGLYHSQLARVLQSHACVKEAGYALTIMLKPHLPRYKQMLEDMGDVVRRPQIRWLPEDNPTLFTFWTCLQLESDIVAELEVPQSDILSLESIMPWPNLTMAQNNNEISAKASWCYSMQLVYRKKLNIIHRDLYGPGKEDEYQLAEMNRLPKFPYIEAMIDELQKVMNTNPNLVWGDDDPPSSDILEARLRAKMYGAEVITTRHFLRMVLNSQYDGNKNVVISAPIMQFAQRCIRAMFHSAQAFWGIQGGRLVVTNVWGTSHAQWGHLIVLHAAYRDLRLRPYVPARHLMELTKRVRQFLVSAAHPSSALADDIRILDYATEASGLREDMAAMSRRGSQGGSRGGSGGVAGSGFGSNGSDMGVAY